ncbi:hypothetical protein NEILACOT_05486 [Neisseria lactamica ATCC 23970]|uniref:Uncharacterized protein n=1 Tax=Neisseria lactamica ATCC 23970 TaxID=546265 RepID=D0WD50_NEILA|nr:hypothetical protein NEILACOT_05486 [Neisseria lactamica ATCC 23970]
MDFKDIAVVNQDISHRLSGNIIPFVVLFDTVYRAMQHRLSGSGTPFCRYITPFSVHKVQESTDHLTP